MNNEYYILEDDNQLGPFTYSELIERDIDIYTQIQTPTNEWAYASELPEFNAYFESKGIYFPTQDNIASTGWRILAFIIDYIILGIIVEIIAVKAGWLVLPTTPNFTMPPPHTVMTLQIAFYSAYLIYNTLFEITNWQGSIGKRICCLRVVDINGQKIGFLKTVGRNVGSILSLILLVPYLSILLSEYKQEWYDNLAKAYMIRVS